MIRTQNQPPELEPPSLIGQFVITITIVLTLGLFPFCCFDFGFFPRMIPWTVDDIEKAGPMIGTFIMVSMIGAPIILFIPMPAVIDDFRDEEPVTTVIIGLVLISLLLVGIIAGANIVFGTKLGF